HLLAYGLSIGDTLSLSGPMYATPPAAQGQTNRCGSRCGRQTSISSAVNYPARFKSRSVFLRSCKLWTEVGGPTYHFQTWGVLALLVFLILGPDLKWSGLFFVAHPAGS